MNLAMNKKFKSKKRIKKILIIPLLIIIQILYIIKVNSIYADEMDSTNYHIKDLTIGASGEGDQIGTNYRLLQSIGDNLNDDRFASGNYKLGIGVAYNWMATAPSINCFETTTEGSTNCDDAQVNPDGMVMVCGEGGCFDRARFEINNENNPSDTLYSIQISTDPLWATWNFIDGATYLIETSASHNINDYRTESDWEGTATNILGFERGTTYYIRGTALHGDFTESDPGPDANTTTGQPEVTFDIDIDDTGGGSSETASPYSIALGSLTIGSVTTATDLIWFDIGSNAPGGTLVLVEDDYIGLYSAIETYTLSSATEDLNVVSDGYGLQEYTASESYLGPLAVESDFGSGGNNVGGVSTTAKKIYNTTLNPIYQGRAGIYVKAKSSLSTPPATDYEDDITFVAVGTY